MIDKKQITVRLPQTTVDYLYLKAENENKSLNDIMTEITEEYMKWQECVIGVFQSAKTVLNRYISDTTRRPLRF